MFEKDLFAKAYQRQLIHEAEISRQPRPVQVPAPGLRDRLFLILGDRLISIGQRVKGQSAFSQLTEECA